MDITTLLQSQENKTLEFKQNLSSHGGILQTLIAFANTHFRVTLFTKPKPANISKLDEMDRAILALFKGKRGLSTKEIADAISLSTKATRSRLVDQVNKGIIIEIGTGLRDPLKKYFLSK